MYFKYSVAHLSSLFDGAMPVRIAGHVIIWVFGSSLCTKYFARFMWSSVVIITTRSSSRSVAIFFIANAFWYVDFDFDSIIAGRSVFIPDAPAPIMYRSAFGYSFSLRIAKGMRRSSPVNTKILSFGKISPHLRGECARKYIPPMTKQLNNIKDGVSKLRIICLLF